MEGRFPLIPMSSLPRRQSNLLNTRFIPRLDAVFSDLPDKEGTEKLGVLVEDVVGWVVIPPLVNTENLLKSKLGKLTGFEREWAPFYDFHVFDMKVVIQPKPGYKVNWVTIFLNLQKCGKGRPKALWVFPKVEFVDENWKIEGHFGVTGKAGFDHKKILEAEVDAGLRFDFKYAPRVAKISSGAAGPHLFWNFAKTPKDYPTGELQILSLLMRPRDCQKMYAEVQLSAEFDIRLARDQVIPVKGTTNFEFTVGSVPQ